MITKEPLKSALSLMKLFNNQKSNLPILACAAMKWGDGSLSLQTTDLESHVETTIPIAHEYSGEAVVTLSDLWAVVDSAENKSTVALRTFTDTDGVYTRVLLEGMGVDLATFPTDEFPVFEFAPGSTVAVNAGEFKQVISRVAFAAAKDEIRPSLACVHLVFNDGTMGASATDGFRLAMDSCDVTGDASHDILVSAGALTTLIRAIGKYDGEMNVSFDDKTRVQFSFGETKVTCNYDADLSFPDLSVFFNSIPETKVSIQKEALMRPLTLAKKMKWDHVNMRLKQDMLVLANYGNTAAAEVEARVENYSEIKSAFDPLYLTQAVEAFPPKAMVDMRIREGMEPLYLFLAGSDNFIQLVMPMSIGK